MTKYIRKFPCAVCKTPLIAEKIINGWTLTCGCGTIHTDAVIQNSSWYERFDAA